MSRGARRARRGVRPRLWRHAAAAAAAGAGSGVTTRRGAGSTPRRSRIPRAPTPTRRHAPGAKAGCGETIRYGAETALHRSCIPLVLMPTRHRAPGATAGCGEMTGDPPAAMVRAAVCLRRRRPRPSPARRATGTPARRRRPRRFHHATNQTLLGRQLWARRATEMRVEPGGLSRRRGATPTVQGRRLLDLRATATRGARGAQSHRRGVPPTRPRRRPSARHATATRAQFRRGATPTVQGLHLWDLRATAIRGSLVEPPTATRIPRRRQVWARRDTETREAPTRGITHRHLCRWGDHRRRPRPLLHASSARSPPAQRLQLRLRLCRGNGHRRPRQSPLPASALLSTPTAAGWRERQVSRGSGRLRHRASCPRASAALASPARRYDLQPYRGSRHLRCLQPRPLAPAPLQARTLRTPRTQRLARAQPPPRSCRTRPGPTPCGSYASLRRPTRRAPPARAHRWRARPRRRCDRRP